MFLSGTWMISCFESWRLTIYWTRKQFGQSLAKINGKDFWNVWEPSMIVSFVFGVHSTKYYYYLVYFHHYLHLVDMFSLLIRHLGFGLNSILFSLLPLVFRLLCFVLELRKIIVTSLFQSFPQQNTGCETGISNFQKIKLWNGNK